VARAQSLRFASGSWDTTVKLWDVATDAAGGRPVSLEPAASMPGHTQAVSCLCWPEGGTIYRCAQLSIHPYANGQSNVNCARALVLALGSVLYGGLR
jgi:WD40 repeat protein